MIEGFWEPGLRLGQWIAFGLFWAALGWVFWLCWQSYD